MTRLTKRQPHTIRRIISILLVLSHIFVFCLKDMGVVFAEDTQTEQANQEVKTNDSQSAPDNSQPQESDKTEGESSETEEGEDSLEDNIGPVCGNNKNSASFNLSALQGLQPSLFTGAITYSLAIDVPSGRKGIQPNISLAYSSQSGNDLCGMGWSVDLGSIERSTKNGVPTYNNNQDNFIFKSGGSTMELVNIGGNEYRSKIEGSFMKFTLNGSSWVVKDKSGITYYFGQTQDSQQVSGSHIFKWCLDRVEDTLGNYMTLTYIKDANQIYPDTVNYTGYSGSPSLSPAFQVDFNYVSATRNDYFFSYRPNFLVRTNKLLESITVKQNGDRIRKYALSYQYSPSTKRALLSSIKQYGLTDATSFPAITFTYQQKPFSFSDITSWNNIHNFGDNNWTGTRSISGQQTYVDTFDINRDGLPDRVFRGYNSSDYDRLWVQLNNGTSFDNLQAWSYISAQPGQTNKACVRYGSTEGKTNTFDINGDGLPDRVYIDYNGNYNVWEVQLNNGNSFDSSISWTNIDGFNYAPEYTKIWGFAYDPPVWGHIDLIDMDSDGEPDRVIHWDTSDRWFIQFNTGGTSFANTTQWLNVQYRSHRSESYIKTGNTNLYFATFDINGDGLVDHLMDNNTGDNTWDLLFNNGVSFEDIQTWGPLENCHGSWSYMGYGNPGCVATIDINGDGLPDRVMRNYNNQFGPWQVQINNGHSFESIVEWGPIVHNNVSDRAHIRAGFQPTHVDFFDINGDGLPDRVMRGYSGYDHWDVQLNNGPMPDLLSTVSNGIGGSATVTYDTYIGHDNTEVADRGKLGFPVNVLISLSTSDGRGNSYASQYSYDKGEFDYQEREFRGFGKVRVTDADGNYSINYFHQDKYKKGRTYRQDTFNSSGNLYTKSENNWQVQENVYSGYPDIQFVYLSESNNYTYEGDASGKRVKTEYIYEESPQYGNPTRIIEYGEVNLNTGSDIGQDKRTSYNYYTYNTNNWIMSAASRVVLKDINANTISEKKFYYDGHAQITDPPEDGLLTQEKVWLYNPITSQEQWPSAQYAYDTYGNLISSTDANNNTTSTTYDTTYHIYPLTVTNALGHTVSSAYYGINGVPLDDGAGLKGLFGQLKSTTDPNNATSYSTYDDLGRPIKAVGPKDTINYPGAIYEYDLDVTNPQTDPVKITKKIKAIEKPSSFDYPYYYATYSFYDGLGRVIETKSEAEPDPATGQRRQIISGIAQYNNRGQVWKKYLPYFVEESANFVSPNYSQPYFSFTYDCLGRLIQTVNPDSTQSSTSFDDWIVTATDENSNYKTYYYDAMQRLVQVDEHNGAETYSTAYQYDILGNLTQVTDAQANSTIITYDSLARKLRMQDPDMGAWNYEYDNVGNLLKQTDAAGQEINFTYDALNRLTQKSVQGGSSVTYEYDDPNKSFCVGRLSRATYDSGSAEFYYDELGRETSSSKTIYGESYYMRRIYDPLNRITLLSCINYQDIYYTYNPQGIETIRGPWDEIRVSNIDYSATSQITKIEYGNGVTTEYEYNPQTLRLTRLVTQNSQQELMQDLEYSFDNVGNIIQIIDNANSASQSFQYDDLNRLTFADGTNYGQISYSYDKIGNILTKGELTYTYADSRPHAVSSVTNGEWSVNYIYDDNGNLYYSQNEQTNEQNHYTYDAESRLKSVEWVNGSESSYSEFFYDGDGGRVKKLFRTPSRETTTIYLGSLIERIIPDQGQEVVKQHIYAGPNRVCVLEDSSPKYFHSDHLGSSNVISDDNGAKICRYEYSPFGETALQEGSYSTDTKYTGKIQDDTGLYYYGARYYDPVLGRFITPDSIVQAPQDPQTLNRYAYCRNNPIKYIDPTGHFFFAAIAAIVKAACAAASAVATAASATASYIAANAGAIFTGALVGGGVGGIAAAATGGNIGMGILTGALGGAVFGGLTPGLNSLTNSLARGLSLGSGVSGPLTAGWSMTSNFTAGFLAGAASGATVALATGADVGKTALIGGAVAGGFSLARDTALWMRAKMVQQSRLDPRNSSGISEGIEGDNFKLAGARFDPSHPNAAPAPLGGIQGEQGKIFGFNYPPKGIINHILESWAGPHDWLNSWTYDSMGNLRNLNLLEKGINTFTNPLNVVIATPIAVPLALPREATAAPGVIYGNRKE